MKKIFLFIITISALCSAQIKVLDYSVDGFKVGTSSNGYYFKLNGWGLTFRTFLDADSANIYAKNAYFNSYNLGNGGAFSASSNAVRITAPNTTDGDIQLVSNGAIAYIIDQSQSDALVFTGTKNIMSNTSDGADNGKITIAGGGGTNVLRGASIALAGNENASTGELRLNAGNVPGGHTTFVNNGAISWQIKQADATYGANSLVANGAYNIYTGGYGDFASLRIGGTAVIDASRNLSNIGTANFAGAISIGNTVNLVSPTSPDRTITVVANGTTYYVPAKTTND